MKQTYIGIAMGVETTDKRKCYYQFRYLDELFFSYCSKCKRAKFKPNPESNDYFVPTITTDINENKQCINFIEE